MKKTWTVLLLSCVLFFVLAGAAFAQDAEAPAELIEYDYDELNVGGITPMSGNFFCSLWGNVTSDIDVRMLLHAYDLVIWNNEEGMFALDDSVVSGIVVTENNTGDRTYTIVLYDDLYYSDGTRITAWDYAFSTLLTMSPEAEAIGGMVKRPEYLLGYNDYIRGAIAYLPGFRVISDDQLAITISADYLPYFYELGLLSTIPYPISVIAPGIRVADDGNGVYLTNEAGSDAVFSAEMLQETILDPVSGYMSHPTVTSGPYKLVSYENGAASFEINEYYKGDVLGFKPTIQRLTYRSYAKDEIIPAFADGTVGLLNKITAAENVEAGIGAVQDNGEQLGYANYLRSGLAYISFAGERSGVNEQEVRQAIAYLIDRDAFVMNTVGNYGLRVDGYYGMGQWMYQILTGAIAYPVDDPEESGMTQAEYDEEIEKWESLTLEDIPAYEYDPEAAAELLDEAGWNLNAEGGAWTGGVRYKQTEAGLVPLRLTLACPEGTSAMNALTAAAENLAAGGIELTVTPIVFEDLLEQFYGMKEKESDMYFLSSNFDILYDPSVKFAMNEAGEPVWYETGIADEELYELTVAMRSTEPGELLEYVENWLEFQKRFEEVLPMIPLYSNVYFDFYPRVLHEYNIASNMTWSQAIVDAYMADVIEEEEIADEGEEIFEGAEGLIELDDGRS